MSLSRIRGVFFRYYYSFWKGIHHLADLFYWPLVDILLWGLASVWIRSQSDVPMLPLMMMTALIFWQIAWRGSADISINLLQEFWHRNLINLFSTPLKLSEWICGVLLVSLCKLGVSILFGSIVVYILYALNVFTVGWAFIPFAAMLLMFGWTLGFIAAGCIVYRGHQVEMLAWMIVAVFAPFSAVFYPVDVLPRWAQTISWCLPTTYVFEGMRQILHGQPFPLTYFWYSFGINTVYLCISVFFFRKMFELSRNKGLARLE